MADEKQNGGSRGVGKTTQEIQGHIGEMIARHVVQLSEHVTSIQVVATKLEADGTTIRFSYGSGDMYARAKSMETLLADINDTFP